MKQNSYNSSEKINNRNSIIWLTKKPKSLKQRTFIIVGVERGGTSMVAGVIRSFGIYGGKRLGRNHEYPAFITNDKELLLRTIKFMNETADTWWVKMPKLSLNLNFILKNVRNPLIIFVNRNFTAVMNSWSERVNSDSLDVMLHSLNYYNKIIESIKKNNTAAFTVDYEYACSKPKKFVSELGKSLDLSLDESQIKKGEEMITADGGGYVDLPEFNFTVRTIDPISKTLLNKKSKKEIAIFKNDSFINLTTEQNKVEIKFKSTLKKIMVINIDIEFKNMITKIDNIIRFYADFNDGFVPATAHRPYLIQGNNDILLIFDNLPKRIGLGVINNNISISYKINHIFEIDDAIGLIFLNQHTKIKNNLFKKIINFIKS